MPSTSPGTYAVLGLSCIIYAFSFMWTLRIGGGGITRGGLFGIDIGGVDGGILDALGASGPLVLNLQQPWRFVTAIFLHASLLHIAFNMWFLMDFGPLIEEIYGTARFLFIYVFTGIGGYFLAAYFGSSAVGGSGALLGLVGLLLAMSMGRRDAGMQMLRQQLVYVLIYIAVISFRPGISLLAHVGGFLSGFALGKILKDQLPRTPSEHKLASILGWVSVLLVVASFAMVARTMFQGL